MITYEEFKKAVAIVKEYQLQIETDYKEKKKEFVNLETSVYSPDTKLEDTDITINLINLLRHKDLNYDSTIAELASIQLNDLLKIRGFGKERLKEVRKIKSLAGL